MNSLPDDGINNDCSIILMLIHTRGHKLLSWVPVNKVSRQPLNYFTSVGVNDKATAFSTMANYFAFTEIFMPYLPIKYSLFTFKIATAPRVKRVIHSVE